MNSSEKRRLGITFIVVWVLLVIYAIFDPQLMNDFIPMRSVLEESSFARIMFIDIGVFSTISCFWILNSEKSKRRYPFALAVLFVGSFALLPFLAIHNLLPEKVAQKTNKS
ncbi:hypothetical protein H6763_02485 [Candidatus Nomurabacteria bacterium]|uniref:DUF2834 domain-containing protein n=1 Tax=Candidatus Dojkabacteria bacterium TaxID=2099670 RepID=A0A955I929_9BACT|nr:hypothetical protein [Candidatus Dojkabacteria bacterium]MCB9790386.1 hypothetical protein [Candidatus Nomurabacteria bacterium]MCB9803674.1 hypothetical protein [Candidatus Nomurabacteria bacterium]